MRLLRSAILQVATLPVLFIAGCRVGLIKEYATEQKLADCKSNITEVRYSCPTGDYFSLVLGVPKGQADSLNLNGQVTIESVDSADDHRSFKFQGLTSCNWLANDADDPQLAGYILLWSTVATNQLGSYMTEGKSYDIQVAFDSSPPEGSSLWMHWLTKQ